MAIDTNNPMGADPAGMGGTSLDDGRFETLPREVVEADRERKERLRREADEAEADRRERPPKAAG